MADFNTVATEFTKFYYSTFDTDRSLLKPLYRENSMMTFETKQVRGVQDIIDALTALPFRVVLHRASTVDAHPAGPTGNIIVLVTGELLIDDSPHPQKYSQAFHLIPEAGSYYVLNDIFRLVYAAES